MHKDTATIVALWEVDHAIDSIRSEIKRLYADVDNAKQAITDADNALALREGELKQCKESERALARKLEMYVGQRDRTKEMLDTGTAPDYGAAKKQYEQCAVIADTTEAELLAAMEASELATAERDAALKKIEETKHDLTVAQEARKAKDHDLRADLEKQTPVRDTQLKALHPDDRVQYSNLRRLGKEPVAEIRDGNCFQCHTEIAPQSRIEVIQGKATHRCRGCQRWLLPTENPAPTMTS